MNDVLKNLKDFRTKLESEFDLIVKALEHAERMVLECSAELTRVQNQIEEVDEAIEMLKPK